MTAIINLLQNFVMFLWPFMLDLAFYILPLYLMLFSSANYFYIFHALVFHSFRCISHYMFAAVSLAINGHNFLKAFVSVQFISNV